MSRKYILAVTGCPTGIAHTYMAAEVLTKTAKKLDYKFKVETRGQNVENILTDEEIALADGIIIACDVDASLERFGGKKVIIVPVAQGITKAAQLFKDVLSDDLEIYQSTATTKSKPVNNGSSKSATFYKHIMNGVNHMLPFVVAGGILIALRFVFGTEADIAAGVEPLINMPKLGQFFGDVGGAAFALLLPVLAGYISFSIANKPGLVVGFVAGSLAVATGAGFLGALIGGFAAGYLAL